MSSLSIPSARPRACSAARNSRRSTWPLPSSSHAASTAVTCVAALASASRSRKRRHSLTPTEPERSVSIRSKRSRSCSVRLFGPLSSRAASASVLADVP
eukprot:5483273-Prymnesium_polylepis.1